METELIKVNFDNQTVSARELYQKLSITERFNSWMRRMITYGFEENVDYTGCKVFNTLAHQELDDYQLSIDMAKQICMIQRSTIGKQIRQYFIDLEKAWNTPEQVMARALKIADTTIDKLRITVDSQAHLIEEQKPKVEYCDKVLADEAFMPISVIAKDYGMSAVAFNKLLHGLNVQYKVGKTWVLYARYQNENYTKLFTDIKNDHVCNTLKWNQKGKEFIYNLLKDNGILPMSEREVC